MTLAVFVDSLRQGNCRSCGALITWAELTSGKRHPFNGRVTQFRTRPSLFPDDAREVVDVDTRAHSSHFATCPQAAHHRRAHR